MKTKLDDMTLGELREIAALFTKSVPTCQNGDSPWEVGKNYFLRTVTHHFTGKLVAVHASEIVLTQAAWIADDGRFADAVAKGTFSEVEPFPADAEVIVNRASLVDAVKVTFQLPCSSK